MKETKAERVARRYAEQEAAAAAERAYVDPGPTPTQKRSRRRGLRALKRFARAGGWVVEVTEHRDGTVIGWVTERDGRRRFPVSAGEYFNSNAGYGGETELGGGVGAVCQSCYTDLGRSAGITNPPTQIGMVIEATNTVPCPACGHLGYR